MRISTLLFLLVALVTSWSAAAQNSQPITTNLGSPSHRLAAETLLNTFYSDATFNDLIDKIITTQMKPHPELQRFEPEMRSFMQKYMSWSVLKPDVVTLYVQDFTEPELVEITRFYKSPVGQKAVARLPTMMQKCMEIGQRHVQEHMPELQKIFEGQVAPSTPQPVRK